MVQKAFFWLLTNRLSSLNCFLRSYLSFIKIQTIGLKRQILGLHMYASSKTSPYLAFQNILI